MKFRSCARMFYRLTLCLVLAAGRQLAQSAPPAQPFQADHLLWIDVDQPQAEHAVQAAIVGLNRAIVKAGCPACTYHLWKVAQAPSGSYNFVQVSHWPSGAIYDQIHGSPDYLAASKDWEGLRSVVMKGVYSREI